MPGDLIHAQQLLARLRSHEVQTIKHSDLQEIVASRFPELHVFRLLLGEDSAGHSIPYTIKKKKMMIYRALFALIGCLFFALAYLIFTMVPLAVCHQFFHNCYILQGVVKMFCLLIGLGSLTFSFYLRAEREALAEIFNKGKEKLSLFYVDRQTKLERYQDSSYIEQLSAKRMLDEKYKKALDSLQSRHQHTQYMLIKISGAKNLSLHHKETLFNQALAELQEEIDRLRAAL